MQWYDVQITYAELEELLAIYKKTTVFAGDTISHTSINSLRDKNLITKNNKGEYICTDNGKLLVKKILEVVDRCNKFLDQRILKVTTKDSI